MRRRMRSRKGRKRKRRRGRRRIRKRRRGRRRQRRRRGRRRRRGVRLRGLGSELVIDDILVEAAKTITTEIALRTVRVEKAHREIARNTLDCEEEMREEEEGREDEEKARGKRRA